MAREIREFGRMQLAIKRLQALVGDTSPFVETLLNDASASAFLTTLGVSTFIKTLLDDTSGSAALVTLGIDTSSYTPTHTLTTNIAASTAYLSPYIQIDNYVIGVGVADIDCTLAAPTASEMGISLPIASDFNLFYRLAGVMTCGAIAETGELIADTVNDRMTLNFAAQTTANHRVVYAYMYVVL
jgi:hypothetical protein